MSELLASSPATAVLQSDDFQWDGHSLEHGIALTLSGGGYRAMLFHAGALLRLNELGMLSRIDRICSVSGGSITAGYLASVWARLGTPHADGTFAHFQTMVVEPLLRFSREDIDIKDVLIGFLPWTTAAQQVAASYDKFLFHDLTLQDIPDRPQFVFCATNLQTGVLWRFTKPYAGDYLVGRLDKPTLRLATAVAASSAFPPFLSPLVLEPPPGSFTDWPSRVGTTAAFDPEPFRRKIVLADGGVYDNLGLEPAVKRYTTILASDGGAPFARSTDLATNWFSQVQRVVDVIDNQVRAVRMRDLIARFKAATPPPGQVDPHARFGAYWGIDTDPAKVSPPDALPCTDAIVNELAHLGTRLSNLGDTQSKQLINWGYTICDRCVRVYYNVDPIPNKPVPTWPYPEVPLG